MPDSWISWGSLIRVDPNWINNFLITHTKQPVPKDKIVTRVYSIKFASTNEHMDGLVSYMRDRIVNYAYSDKEIKDLKAKEIEPWPEARDHFFGPIGPTFDGKCGELLLYLFVEAIFGTPMVAHKIKCVVDNPNTQVHGSDGVFIGRYRNMDCLLLGEAKMYQTKEGGLDEALKSVNKFYDPAFGFQVMNNELMVIKDMATKSISKKQLQYLEKVLNTQSSEYRNITKAHPILVIYDENKIKDIEVACRDASAGEALILKEFQDLDNQLLSTIVTKIDSNWAELKKVY